MQPVLKILLAALLLWNLITFLMMGIDKGKAKKDRRRIPERILLLSALAFGSIGAMSGMYLFHHKTLHNRFRFGLPAMVLLQIAVAVGLAWCYIRWFVG